MFWAGLGVGLLTGMVLIAVLAVGRRADEINEAYHAGFKSGKLHAITVAKTVFGAWLKEERNDH